MSNQAFYQSYQCLDLIFRQGAFSTIELNKTLLASDKNDKALITKIVYGVLDKNIELCYLISHYATKIKPSVITVLKIGVYALMYLNIPRFAAVNDSVNLVKAIGKTQLSGFINGTLKQISYDIDNNDLVYPTDEIENISVKNSFPLWAVKKLIASVGLKETKLIVSHIADHTFSHLRVNTKLIDTKNFKLLLDKNKVEYQSTVLTDSLFVKTQNMSKIPSKYYAYQSLSSMLVCLSLDLKDNATVLDLCAAPGGKAIYLSTLKNVSMTACDIYQHRLDLIKNYADRFSIDTIKLILNDSTVLNKSFIDNFDYVLCDVPCSGYGVFESKPDIKLFRKEEDILSLNKIQLAILNNAAKYVKKGGTIVYSTCSIFKEENDDIITKFLEINLNFQLAKIILPQPFNDEGGMIHIYPHKHNTEGFFIAKLTRI